MEQITRILTLYQRLIEGKIINKALFAMEFGTSERSVDRDFLAVRFFLSDSFSNLELVYDRKKCGYRLENLCIKQEIGLGECYLFSKLLLDKCPLRTDEQDRTIQNLLSHLSAPQRERASHTLKRTPKTPTQRNKTSLKLIEDLLYSIEQQDQIILHFGDGYADVACVPYSVEFPTRKAYLVAIGSDRKMPILYSLDDIVSYRPTRQPYNLSHAEEIRLQDLVRQIYEGNTEEYVSFIFQKKARD